MDGHEFDRWIRTLGTGIDRRTTLKRLAAGAVAAATGSLACAPRADAAQIHVCCMYDCLDGTYRHRCVRNEQVCPAELQGCQKLFLPEERVTKCSACGGDIFGQR